MIDNQKTSNDILELNDQKLFGCEDLSLLFDIVRSKLYSNPILAVCREISCNARDSHREAGKPDEPIEIHLPTALEPEYTIKDFGVGLSPDRINNVFCNYTSSTKRGDNSQVGRFGIGSKAPWSVSSEFAVITIYNGIKYFYTCFIDETKTGAISLLGKETTDQSNGTEILVPVKPQDFHSFKQYTEQACRHWTVMPRITNDTIQWQTFESLLEGNRWKIVKGYSYNNHIKLIVDGIEYPLDSETLHKYADTSLIDNIRDTLALYFDTGELSLSANREQIYLDKPTQEKIKGRLQEVILHIVNKVQSKIDSFPNLWEANVYYSHTLQEIFSSLSFLDNLFWKDIELKHNSHSLLCNNIHFSNNKYRKHATKKFLAPE
jgi:hypothetical protein